MGHLSAQHACSMDHLLGCMCLGWQRARVICVRLSLCQIHACIHTHSERASLPFKTTETLPHQLGLGLHPVAAAPSPAHRAPICMQSPKVCVLSVIEGIGKSAGCSCPKNPRSAIRGADRLCCDGACHYRDGMGASPSNPCTCKTSRWRLEEGHSFCICDAQTACMQVEFRPPFHAPCHAHRLAPPEQLGIAFDSLLLRKPGEACYLYWQIASTLRTRILQAAVAPGAMCTNAASVTDC